MLFFLVKRWRADVHGPCVRLDVPSCNMVFNSALDTAKVSEARRRVRQAGAVRVFCE